MHRAASQGQDAIITLLIEWGGDPDSSDNDNNTPLHLACQSGHAESVALLLQNGVSADKTNSAGQTPLESAPPSQQAILKKIFAKELKTEKSSCVIS
jgi:26S proteasome non-ATPase regulatory subunit 10